VCRSVLLNEWLRVGARVRVTELEEAGTITRIDARGVRVRLDSGREVLAEPRLLVPLVDGKAQ